MKNLLYFLLLFIPMGVTAQMNDMIHIKGTVQSYIDGKETTPVFGAEVFLKNAKKGDVTDEKGNFFVMTHGSTSLPDTLIIRASGYYSDTVVINSLEGNQFRVTLYPEFVAEEVVIKARRANSSILRLDPRNVESLNSGELRKAACCNLSESFSTTATVNVSLSDGVSGSKRIKMLGLAGKYTQFQFENIPFMHNLDQPFGMAGVPGTWIESIHITKGAGSVINGYESMSGVINIEYWKPKEQNRFFVNGYGSIHGRGELNVQGVHIFGEEGKEWGTAYLLHGSSMLLENDRNKDNFRDIPIGSSFIGMNRWRYRTAYFDGQIGVKVNYSDKQGGQIGYNRYANQHEQGLYGVGIRNLNVEAFAKTGFMFKENRFSSIGVIYYAKHDELNTAFGHRYLDAIEQRGYINTMYSTILGNTNHNLVSGLSFVYDNIDQTMMDKLPMDTTTRFLNRTEIVPGIFTEYTYNGILSTVVLGFRADYHNLYGWQFTPRANYKFNITEDMSVRLTAGSGFRISNYMTDYLSLMATNLPWEVEANLRPEESWNFGGSWLWNLDILGNNATISADFFHTLFTNQLIADRDESTDFIRIRNLIGRSYSNAFQVNFMFEPFDRFTVKTAYKFLDVKATTGGELQTVMMIPKHRGLINLNYETKNRRWQYDLTFTMYGRQRLAIVQRPNGTFTEKNHADSYPMLNAQITHKFKRFDIYVGGENILDYRLKNPIIGVENPFDKRFDATRIYAPIYGVNIYAGFRFNI